MLNIIVLLTIAFISSLVSPPSKAAFFGRDETKQIIVILDNSLVSPAINQTPKSEPEGSEQESISEDEASEDLRMAIEWMLSQLLTIRSKQVSIDILLTTKPNYTIFSGGPSALESMARQVVENVALTDTCSDIKLALTHAMSERKGKYPQADHLEIIILSPMIHVPFPCGQDSGVSIVLPQPVDPGIGLVELAKESVSIRHYWVDGDQQKMLLDFYAANGLMGSPDTRIEINGVEATKSLMYNRRTRLFAGE